MKLDAAVRTSKRKTDARSPGQQRDMVTACANVHGYEIARWHDSGRDESGGTMDRATLNAVMERVRTGQTDGLIVALTDRLSRAPIDEAMRWIRSLIEEHEGVLVLADAGGTPVDLTDPQAETNLVLQLQMARQYRQGVAKRALTTKQEAILAGRFVGPTPLGYRRERGRLHPHPKTGRVITETYRIAASEGVSAAAAYLRERVPGRRWDTSHVRHLLARRVYLGESYSGKIVNRKAHKRLTDPETFAAAQSTARARRRSGDYELSHHVHCERCRHGLVGGLQTVPAKRRDPDDWHRHVTDPSKASRTYRRYRCANPACKGGTSINADKLEAHVRSVVQGALTDEDFRASFRVAGLEVLRQAMIDAEVDATAWAQMPRDRRAKMGRARYDAGLDVRLEEEAQASAAYHAAARAASQEHDLPTADELSKPGRYAAALRAITTRGRIIVSPGRGTVEGRTRFVRHGHDVAVGVGVA